ncbi:MAG: hypothetical protein DHS20C15_20670 [Planctomycetota bacterium]|nr:MAG: hypothetical protein DHS20C15_20670 [Planctomycetota bacterium]
MGTFERQGIARRVILSLALPLLVASAAYSITWEAPFVLGELRVTQLIYLRDQPMFWPALVAVTAAWLWFIWSPSSKPDDQRGHAQQALAANAAPRAAAQPQQRQLADPTTME